MLLRLEIPPQGVDLGSTSRSNLQNLIRFQSEKYFCLGAFFVEKDSCCQLGNMKTLFSKHIHNDEGILVVKYKSCVAGLVVVALINIKLAPTGTMRIFLATSKISTSANTQIHGVTTTNMNMKFRNRNTNTF